MDLRPFFIPSVLGRRDTRKDYRIPRLYSPVPLASTRDSGEEKEGVLGPWTGKKEPTLTCRNIFVDLDPPPSGLERGPTHRSRDRESLDVNRVDWLPVNKCLEKWT